MLQLADCAVAFHEEYPKVRFSFFSGSGDVVKERMDRGLIDVGLLMEPIELEKYEYIRMQQAEQMAAFMRPDDPLATKDAISPEDPVSEHDAELDGPFISGGQCSLLHQPAYNGRYYGLQGAGISAHHYRRFSLPGSG